MNGVGVFNALVAVIGGLVAFGALHRMSPKTECVIIFAFALTGIGLFAQAFGTIFPAHWQAPLDTLLYGGATALMIGTRKQTLWLAPEWMPKLSAMVSCATLAVFLWGLEP